jgi:hypothetical protein
MADKKISALPAATTPLAGTEVLPIVQSGATDQVSVANLTAGRGVSALTLAVTDATDASSSTNAPLKSAGGLAVAKSGIFGTDITVGAGLTSTGGNIRTAGSYALILGYDQAGGATLAYAVSGDLQITPRSGYDTSVTAGNVIFGTAAKGINFTANTGAAGKTSQLLNWYEEGTWTPTFSSGVTSPTYTYQNGFYTRIGRQVSFSVRISLSGGTANSSQLKIGGLPFTSSSSDSFGAANVAYLNNFTTSLSFTALVNSSSTTIDFYNLNGSSFVGTDANSITQTLILNGTYFV